MLRAWREPDDPDGPLRVRVLEVGPADARSGRARAARGVAPPRERTRRTTTSVEAVVAEVAAWLEQLGGQRRLDGGDAPVTRR